MEVRYEALLLHTEEILSKTCAFIGVVDSREVVAACVSEESFEVLSAGRQPGQEEQTSFFRKGVSGDWRQQFDEQMARRAWRVAGERLSEFGYSET